MCFSKQLELALHDFRNIYILCVCSEFPAHARTASAMNAEEKLKVNFTCVKCRGKTALTRVVPFKRALSDVISQPIKQSLPEVFGTSGQKFILVSCALCGYTEIYNLAAYAMQSKPAEAAKTVPREI
ncbi:MAG: zinc ribbon domain-containing protein [bacterium]